MFIYTAETVIVAILVAVFIIIKICYSVADCFKYRKCQHESVRETMACDAVCNKCSKNLGFIGTWRDKKDREANEEISRERSS